MRQTVFLALFLFSFSYGCLETQSRKGEDQPPQSSSLGEPDKLVSLLGNVLDRILLTDKVRKKREKELIEALNNYEQEPNSIDNIIWYGRRLAYLGQFSEAIRIFTIGIDRYPDSYKLLRHRGHRYITIRKFDKAIEDLQKAAFYARPYSNEIEPDGLPNRINKPLTNIKYNIWYHLGLAYYLKGNYDKAISSYKKCMEFCDNDDLLVSTTDWFYMTYRKIGNTRAAEQLLTLINRRMRIIENDAYLERLMMYKGANTPEYLLSKAQSDGESIDPTLGYGIGNWYAYNGQLNEAREVLFRITLGPRWDSFGFIAAEVDLLSLKDL